MTVSVFVFSLLGAMAIGMPIAYALLVCGLALMAFMAATGALPAFDSQILAQRFVEYALRRDADPAERCELESVRAGFQQKGDLVGLLSAITSTGTFRSQLVEE